MSFGFSVGDVVLLSQLSYQIYQSITSGRKAASRDLIELGDVLFGLQCALDHLHHVVEDISNAATPTSPQAARDAGMRTKLDQMMKNCATTLEDFVSVTKKYREGVQQSGSDEDGVGSQSTLTRTARLKRQLASNVMKIRWDMDKDTLKVYRDKLQTHADAINLVLNIFVWSSSKEIHKNTEVHMQQLSALHDKVVSTNSGLEKLVKDIHFVVTQNRAQMPPGSTAMMDRARESQPVALMAACNQPIYDVKPHFAGAAHNRGLSLPIRPFVKAVPSPNLPPGILSLNLRRQENAMRLVPKQKEVTEYLPPERPTCLEITETTTHDLIQGLSYIFRAENSTHLDRSRDISTWVRLLNNLMDSRISSSNSKPARQHTDILDLLVLLNDRLEEASYDMRRSFYGVSTAVGVDDTLRKVITSTRSVRVEQLVGEFIDVRQEWIDEQK